jgi:hypothetical protein
MLAGEFSEFLRVIADFCLVTFENANGFVLRSSNVGLSELMKHHKSLYDTYLFPARRSTALFMFDEQMAGSDLLVVLWNPCDLFFAEFSWRIPKRFLGFVVEVIWHFLGLRHSDSPLRIHNQQNFKDIEAVFTPMMMMWWFQNKLLDD